MCVPANEHKEKGIFASQVGRYGFFLADLSPKAHEYCRRPSCPLPTSISDFGETRSSELHLEGLLQYGHMELECIGHARGPMDMHVVLNHLVQATWYSKQVGLVTCGSHV